MHAHTVPVEPASPAHLAAACAWAWCVRHTMNVLRTAIVRCAMTACMPLEVGWAIDMLINAVTSASDRVHHLLDCSYQITLLASGSCWLPTRQPHLSEHV